MSWYTTGAWIDILEQVAHKKKVVVELRCNSDMNLLSILYYSILWHIVYSVLLVTIFIIPNKENPKPDQKRNWMLWKKMNLRIKKLLTSILIKEEPSKLYRFIMPAQKVFSREIYNSKSRKHILRIYAI